MKKIETVSQSPILLTLALLSMELAKLNVSFFIISIYVFFICFIFYYLFFDNYSLLTIRNSSLSAHTLVGCELINKANSLIISDPSGVTKNTEKIQVLIPRGSSYQIWIECDAFNLGWIRDILVFRFSSFNVSCFYNITK